MNALKRSTQLLKGLAPAKVMQARLHKRLFMQFAEKIGLVYFGYVDQRSDEHRLVRGLTVSAHHRDNNYCIGSYDHYDIMLVERTDTVRFPGKSAQNYRWVIMTFDLHTSKDLPHIFLGLHSHDETFYAHLFTKFSQLTRVSLGAFGQHDKHFTDEYVLYTEPAYMVFAEQLFHPAVTKVIAESFRGLTVEIVDGSLYIYADHTHLTAHVLERMLKNGLWLAKLIDYTMAHESRDE